MRGSWSARKTRNRANLATSVLLRALPLCHINSRLGAQSIEPVGNDPCQDYCRARSALSTGRGVFGSINLKIFFILIFMPPVSGVLEAGHYATGFDCLVSLLSNSLVMNRTGLLCLQVTRCLWCNPDFAILFICRTVLCSLIPDILRSVPDI